jgi:hypothetical protein
MPLAVTAEWYGEMKIGKMTPALKEALMARVGADDEGGSPQEQVCYRMTGIHKGGCVILSKFDVNIASGTIAAPEKSKDERMRSYMVVSALKKLWDEVHAAGGTLTGEFEWISFDEFGASAGAGKVIASAFKGIQICERIVAYGPPSEGHYELSFMKKVAKKEKKAAASSSSSSSSFKPEKAIKKGK